MAKRKIKHDVEEKGLDPTAPHFITGQDGRLIAKYNSEIDQFLLIEELKEPEIINNNIIPINNNIVVSTSNEELKIEIKKKKRGRPSAANS